GGVMPLDVAPREHFWLISAFVADVRLGAVRALAVHPDVVHIAADELTVPVRPPSHDGPPDFPPHADIAAGRAAIHSDQYFYLSGMKSGTIGLIDTGTRPHVLLSNLGLQGDCVWGGSSCLDQSPNN